MYDPVTDTIIRFGGYSTADVGTFNIAQRTWSYKIFNGTSYIDRGKPAFDPKTRVIYTTNPYAGILYRYKIGTQTLDDLGPIPGGSLTDCLKQPMIIWDVADNVLLFYREANSNDCPGSFPNGDFQAYHPDTKKWEQLPVSTDVAGVSAEGLMLDYDPGQNVVTLISRLKSGTPSTGHMFLYRYGAGSIPPDPTPPTVSLTSPLLGATVSDTISVTANASDNIGVIGVQFKLDGSNLGFEDTIAPYSVSWNSTTVANGSHTLAATARDAAGNTNTASITVTVSNIVIDTTPPIIANIQSIASSTSATISFTTNEPATTAIVVSTNPGLFPNPLISASPPTTSHTFTLTSLLPATRYFFRVSATDVAGNTRQSPVEHFDTLSTPSPTNPLAPITRIEAEKRTSKTVSLKFEAPDDLRSRPNEYDLRYMKEGTISTLNWHTATMVPNSIIPGPKGTPHQFLLSDLSCGTRYSISVRGKDFHGSLSDLGSVLSIKTKACPPKPRLLSHQFGSVTLSWQQDQYPDGALFYQVIRMNLSTRPTSITDPQATLIGITTEPLMTDQTALPSTTYTYAIASYADYGEFSDMALATLTTPETPTTPAPTPSPTIIVPFGGTPVTVSPTPSPATTPPQLGSGQAAPPSVSQPPRVLFTKLLYVGMRDPEVVHLQRFLIQKGFLALGNDTGFFGPLTRAAVQMFQCQEQIICGGTPKDTGYGLVGQGTRQRLNTLSIPEASPPALPTPAPLPPTQQPGSTSSPQAVIAQLKAQLHQLQLQLLQLLQLQLKMLEAGSTGSPQAR